MRRCSRSDWHRRRNDAHAPIVIYQPVYPAVNEYSSATRRYGPRAPWTHYPLNEAPISPPDLEARRQRVSSSPGVQHFSRPTGRRNLSSRFGPSPRPWQAASARGICISWARHGSPARVAGKQGIRLTCSIYQMIYASAVIVGGSDMLFLIADEWDEQASW